MRSLVLSLVAPLVGASSLLLAGTGAGAQVTTTTVSTATTTTTSTTTTAPPTTTSTRNVGNQLGVRPSRWNDHTAVVATAAASTIRAEARCRRRQSVTVPMPTIAPMAGASATV